MKPADASEQTIFDAARQIADSPARAAYLESACVGNPKLRERIEALLEANQRADEFLAADPLELGQTERQTTQPATMSEAPGAVIDKYKLLEKIGEGGFGEVYMAEQKQPVRRRVALKIIKIGMDTREVVARFEAERQALAMMDHPSIAKVFDGGATETGRPYFVMELVRGIKITEYCDQKNLSTRERLDLFIKVCQGVQHAHQKGIIHRDLKPSNILATVNDGVAVPKIIDFGIAKATQMELTEKTVFTRFQQFMGTPAYMSPEQTEITSVDIDTRSDIYSLGVLLYELLTGQTPFDAKELLQAGLEEMRRTIREREPQRPSTRVGTLGGQELSTTAKRRGLEAPKLVNVLRGDLDWIVMRCLEKDRARRYETANGLAADLKRHLTNEPVEARPPSTVYRIQKAFRRNKVEFSAGIAVASALVAGIGISTWQAVVATRAKTEAVQAKSKAEAAQREAQLAQQAEKQQRQVAEAEKAEAYHILYVGDMNQASIAWEQNNVGQVRNSLAETANNPERGFEWYYWQRQTHLEIKTLRGHHAYISSVAFSPDGQRIVTGSYDETAKVWDAVSGKELRTLKGHVSAIRSVAFSLDGQRIVTGSSDHTARLWDAGTGKRLGIFKGHSRDINSVAFSPDGQRIVTGSEDQTAKVWEAGSGKDLLTLTGHSDLIKSVAFSPDGGRIVTASADSTAKVWDAAEGRQLLTLQGHSNSVSSAAFSPDGHRIVTGSEDQTAKVWEAGSGKVLLTLTGHRSLIGSVAYSKDGRRIVTGSDDHTAKVWEAATGRELYTLKGHNDTVGSVAFSPDGQRIVTAGGDWMGGADNTAKVWDAADRQELMTLRGHGKPINSASFSPDGGRIVTASADSTAKVWDVAEGRELFDLQGHSNQVFSAVFSPDGRRIVTGSLDKTAKVWDATSSNEQITLKGHIDVIYSVAFSPDGQRIVTGSRDWTAKVWDATTSAELLTLKGHTEAIWSVAFSPDGHRIVTGSSDNTAKVWDADTGQALLTLKGHSSGIIWVAFSPDGRRIVTGSSDKTAKVWDATSGEELLTLTGHSDQVWSVAFSPDGRRIVTAGADGTAKVWEAASGKELLTLKGHTGPVRAVAFSPDGQRIVTGSWDQTAKVWEQATVQEVSAWQSEERAAVQEQERQRIARADDVGRIKQWLILAPILQPTGQSELDGLNSEQIEGEGRIRPRAGEASSIGTGELKWRKLSSASEGIDFNSIIGQVTEHAVAYAVCYIRSESEQHGLQMVVTSDDESKIYLNGKEVFQCGANHVFDSVEVTLNAGLNVLVFKVVNATLSWNGSVRLTDAEGNPVKGIKVTLDPEGKE